jgi:hypothetical protein
MSVSKHSSTIPTIPTNSQILNDDQIQNTILNDDPREIQFLQDLEKALEDSKNYTTPKKPKTRQRLNAPKKLKQNSSMDHESKTHTTPITQTVAKKVCDPPHLSLADPVDHHKDHLEEQLMSNQLDQQSIYRTMNILNHDLSLSLAEPVDFQSHHDHLEEQLRSNQLDQQAIQRTMNILNHDLWMLQQHAGKIRDALMQL